jgi:DNA (cytosine-5)-methyltransferase 1
MRIGSLFSGYGGLDMAALALFPGSSVAWHCEWDDAPAKILAHHWPTVPNYRDVTEIDWDAMPPVDILTGGYPCQPFSTAGRRKGTKDERHLWPYVRDAIRLLRPRLTLLENVAGHRTLGFDRVLGDLAEDGMHVQWASLRASDVGAPHQRERLFILVANAADGSLTEWRGAKLEHLAPARREAAEYRECASASPICGRNAAADTSDDGRERAREARDGRAGSADSDSGVHWGTYAPAIRRWERLTRPAPAPTAPNGNGRQRLTAPFAEWMMGLPAGHVTDPAIGISRSHQLKAIGNGVCPQQAIAAYASLLEAAA